MRARTRLALALAVSSACLIAPGAARAAEGWLPPQTLASGSASAVAANANGTFAVVWATSDGVAARVRSPAGVWGPVEPVLTGDPSGFRPDVAVDGAGRVYVAWTGLNATPVVLRVRDIAGAWGAATTLSEGDDTGNDVDVDVNAAGAAAVVWRERPVPPSSFNNRIRARTILPSGAVQAGRYVSPDPVMASLEAFDPRAAVAPDGDVVFAYEIGVPKRPVTNVLDSGVLTPPETGLPQDLDSAGTNPSADIDAAGNVVYVWDGATIETRPRSAAGVFGAIQPVSEGLLAQLPELAVDDAGEARFAWSDRPAPGAELIGRTRTRAPGGALSAVFTATTLPSILASAVAVNGRGDALLACRFSGSGQGIEARAVPDGAAPRAAQTLASAPALAPGDPKAAIDGAGNGLAVWSSPAGIHAAAYDGVAPSLTRPPVPARVERGEPQALAVQPSDNWGPVTVRWDFGDGTGAEGTSVSHAWPVPGNYTVTVTATDAGGNVTSVTGTGPATVTDSRSPRLSRVSLRRGRLRFTLSEPASVRLTAARRTLGRRVGKRCRKGRPRAGQRRCVRFAPVKGAVRFSGVTGRNVKRFRSRVGRRKLRRGAYRLTLVATDPFTNPSRRVRVGLRARR